MPKEKVKKWFKPNFDTSAPPAEKKQKINEDIDDSFFDDFNDFDMVLASEIKPKRIKQTEENWFDRFSPKNITDLAISSKKVQEVNAWLQDTFRFINKDSVRTLLLTGPTGAGKTATIKTLCSNLNIELCEWISPMDTEYLIENDNYGNNQISYTPRQADVFSEFLFQASRYSSLFESSDKKLLLVEDYPNALLMNPHVFIDILEQYHKEGKYPIVFICTDVKGKKLNISNNLFPFHVRNSLNITNIVFNAISATGLKSAVKRVSSLMLEKYSDTYKIVPQESIEAVINSSMGDVRNAIMNLHFISLKGTKQTSIKHETSKQTKNKRTKMKISKLKNIGCDENLTLLHGVGRVLNPKRTNMQSGWRLTRNPEELVDQFISHPSNFISFLHENYLAHFSDIKEVSYALEDLSISDYILSNWTDFEINNRYGLNLAIRSMMVHNKNPVSAWNPVRSYKRLNVETQNIRNFPLLTDMVKNSTLAIDYSTYYKHLMANRNNQNIEEFEIDDLFD